MIYFRKVIALNFRGVKDINFNGYTFYYKFRKMDLNFSN
jgi:hypothetical protein